MMLGIISAIRKVSKNVQYYIYYVYSDFKETDLFSAKLNL